MRDSRIAHESGAPPCPQGRPGVWRSTELPAGIQDARMGRPRPAARLPPVLLMNILNHPSSPPRSCLAAPSCRSPSRGVRPAVRAMQVHEIVDREGFDAALAKGPAVRSQDVDASAGMRPRGCMGVNAARRAPGVVPLPPPGGVLLGQLVRPLQADGRGGGGAGQAAPSRRLPEGALPFAQLPPRPGPPCCALCKPYQHLPRPPHRWRRRRWTQ